MDISLRERLDKLGMTLPAPKLPSANYSAFIVCGPMLYVSGQTPGERERFVGKLGADFDVQQGQLAARSCALGLLAQLDFAIGGDLSRFRRCLRLGGFVNAIADFDAHPAVIDGASDLMIAVFGERGRHARTSVGVASLPRNVAVEVDAIFEIA
jgi:enamine deaminase RidA (YjgF/YER057c/UK114 family)